MRKLILLLLCSGLAFGGFCQSVIEWSPDYEITLADFQSPATEIDSTLGEMNISAGITMEFEYLLNPYQFLLSKHFNDKAKTIFDRQTALLVAPDTTTALQMVHYAQYYFDLTELYTRKFRQAMYEEKNFFSEANFYEPAFHALQQELQAEQARVFKASKLGANAAVLERELACERYECDVIALGTATDPYQPAERELEVTRGCLETFLRHRNPVSIITKNGLVLRDLDLLRELAALQLVRVHVSLTSLRPEIIGQMEPRTARPARRLKTIRRLAEAGIPVGWLREAFPERADKVLRRLAELRDPELDDPRFGHRMRGRGIWGETLDHLFRVACQKHGLARRGPSLSTEHFRRLPDGQMNLF